MEMPDFSAFFAIWESEKGRDITFDFAALLFCFDDCKDCVK